MDGTHSYLDTALAAARVGGKILLENAGNLERRRASQKQRHDFVTQVDVLAEKAIVELIRQRHPDHQILAEESGGSLPENDYVWIIDPLDGTKNYIHGFPMSAVSV
ncbi:MAG: inositol monophosphatase, partial [Calditrichaeota bacterium]